MSSCSCALMILCQEPLLGHAPGDRFWDYVACNGGLWHLGCACNLTPTCNLQHVRPRAALQGMIVCFKRASRNEGTHALPMLPHWPSCLQACVWQDAWWEAGGGLDQAAVPHTGEVEVGKGIWRPDRAVVLLTPRHTEDHPPVPPSLHEVACKHAHVRVIFAILASVTNHLAVRSCCGTNAPDRVCPCA